MAPPLDAQALDAWVRRHERRPWRYLRACGCPADLADDFVQDALLAALHKQVPTWTDADANAWLLGAVRNLWREHLRRLGVERRVLAARIETADRAIEEWAPQDDGEAFYAALRLCMARLDGRAREAIELRYRDGQSRDDMAVRLRLSADGVKTLLRRTRDALRGCVLRRLGGREVSA